MRRGLLAITIFGGLFAAAAVCRLVVGGPQLGFPVDSQIWELRLLRLASGAAVGGGLALGGVLLQSLLRNPLASPDLMGLASGAGFAVMLTTYIGYRVTGSLVQWGGYAAPALIGSVGALALVYALSQRRGLVDPVSMVLVGVVVSLMLGAGTVFFQHLMPDRGQSAARWLMGALTDNATWSQIAAVGASVVTLAALSAWAGPIMDAAALGEDEARSVGVRIGWLRTYQFLASGVLTAGAVVLAGPIGFVGLICPHAARLVGGPAHRDLAVSAALAGAALIVAADALVKTTNIGGGQMPIGVLTAAVGGPAFVLLLRRARSGL